MCNPFNCVSFVIFMDFFFCSKQVVAISGAHGLGGAGQYNQGYQGTWKPGNTKSGNVAALTFNNDFFKIMIDPNIEWFNIDASLKYNNTNDTITGQKWQWEGYPKDGTILEKPYFMLNTDFYVFFNITVHEYGKSKCILDTSCGYSGTCGLFGTCGMSPTYLIGYKYANVSSFFTLFYPFQRKLARQQQIGNNYFK